MFRRSKLGAKINDKSKLFVEFLMERFQDAPRRALDVPKMFQDAPRRTRDGPRPPRGRARTAPRRSQTPQDGSKLVPRGARKRPRRRQIRGKKRHKSDPKRNPLQILFLKRFWADFGRFSDGFGKVLGMILEAWRSIFQGFLGASPKPQETTRRHRKSSIWSASAASERAQRAKRAERLRCSKGYSSGFSGGFTETTEKNTTSQEKRKSQNALPVPLLRQVYVGGGFASHRVFKINCFSLVS